MFTNEFTINRSDLDRFFFLFLTPSLLRLGNEDFYCCRSSGVVIKGKLARKGLCEVDTEKIKKMREHNLWRFLRNILKAWIFSAEFIFGETVRAWAKRNLIHWSYRSHFHISVIQLIKLLFEPFKSLFATVIQALICNTAYSLSLPLYFANKKPLFHLNENG